jgi:hypothetical protein
MTTEPRTATVRETLDELGRRLARIGAAASSLRNMSGDVRQGIPPADLLPLLKQIERDLMLATHQLKLAHTSAQLERSTPCAGRAKRHWTMAA